MMNRKVRPMVLLMMDWEEVRKVETNLGVMLQLLRERKKEARKITTFLLNVRIKTCSVKRRRKHISRR